MDTYLIYLKNPPKPLYPYTPVRCARLIIEQGRLRAVGEHDETIRQWQSGEWAKIVFERSEGLTTADIIST